MPWRLIYIYDILSSFCNQVASLHKRVLGVEKGTILAYIRQACQ